jgi:hypothetical protein
MTFWHIFLLVPLLPAGRLIGISHEKLGWIILAWFILGVAISPLGMFCSILLGVAGVLFEKPQTKIGSASENLVSVIRWQFITSTLMVSLLKPDGIGLEATTVLSAILFVLGLWHFFHEPKPKK